MPVDNGTARIVQDFSARSRLGCNVAVGQPHGRYAMISVDEVVTGLVVDAIAAAGRQLATQVRSGSGRRRRAAVELASFFNTYALLERWSVPAFMDAELGCQLTELPIS